MKSVKIIAAVALTVATIFLVACQPGTKPSDELSTEERFSVAVYVTGVTQGSPTFEMMVQGVTQAIEEVKLSNPAASLKVIEGGFEQGEWQNGITALAATGAYDLIVTSNPSMPAICEEVAKLFPEQKFLILDANHAGNTQIKTIAFDQYQQGWLNGYMAGLVTTSAMPKANQALVIGLLAGQEFPVMNNEIKLGFLAGAQAVNPDISLDFRVLGNWFDATKAEAIARNMIEQGSDYILTIAGGANQGVLSAARDAGAYVGWFDSSAYAQAPGIIVASSLIRLDQAAKTAVTLAHSKALTWGSPDILGIADGAVSFDAVSPDFVQNLPAELVGRMQEVLEGLISGSVPLPRK